MKAIWNDEVIAESHETKVVEGNHPFPVDAVKKEFLENSSSRTNWPWKGQAAYYTIKVNGEFNKDGAWYYPSPKEAAKEIKDHVAFWKGVKLES